MKIQRETKVSRWFDDQAEKSRAASNRYAAQARESREKSRQQSAELSAAMNLAADNDPAPAAQTRTVVAVAPKSIGIAYVLWLFFGGFGVHQFYMGKTVRAVSYLLTFGWLTIGLWVDLFTMGSQVRAVNARMGIIDPKVAR